MIKINEKEYDLKFGFKAMLAFENETGKSISSLGEPSMNDLITMGYCSIKNKDKLTKDSFIDAIDEDMTIFTEVTETIMNDMEAFNAISGEAKK